MMRYKAKTGFTLVELLVVVMILGALAAVAVPRIGLSAMNAKIRACETNVDLINSQIELYYAQEGRWPRRLTQIVDDPNYFPDGTPDCPLGTPYTYSRTTHRVDGHNHH
jgi:prepilin-type N-terminal cleavage/methylation domain-containing protein